MNARITSLGDNAITINFGETIDEEINRQVFSVFDYLRKQNLDFIKDIIPAYASLSVVYDVMHIRKMGKPNAYDHMHDLMETVLCEAPLKPRGENRLIQVPVCYDELFGVDLINMALQTQLQVDEIIQLHSSATYRVYMLGFLPGFPYMGTVNDKIAAPRKAVPNKIVPAEVLALQILKQGYILLIRRVDGILSAEHLLKYLMHMMSARVCFSPVMT
jgi:inhibitor of KinA